jgi:hypothetical protein
MSKNARGSNVDQHSSEQVAESQAGYHGEDDCDLPSSGNTSWMTPRVRMVGLIFGMALILIAIAFVVQQRDALEQAWQHIRRPSLLPLLILPIAVLCNVALSGVLFRVLLSRFGHVGWLEMQAVIAAATLMNFIPLRPGLPGRLLYHRAVNRIPLMKSGRTVIEAAAISIVVGGYLAIAAIGAIRWGINLWYLTIGPLPLLLASLALPRVRLWMLAILVRYIEVLVWAVRYACAFALIGSPIDANGALALAVVSMFATMVPLFSNGLGLREWAIGLVAPFLTAYTMELGIIAELVNRAAELVVISVAGLAGMAYLARRKTERP